MPHENQQNPSTEQKLRLWPGVVLASLLTTGRYLVPLFEPGAIFFAILAGFSGALGILVWWLFFSRAPWLERLGALVFAIIAMLAASQFLHVSVARGNMGFQFILLGVPLMSLAFVAGAFAGRHLPRRKSLLTMAAVILLAAFGWTLVRSNGLKGDGMAELTWRFTPTAEELLLAQEDDDSVALVASPGGEASWPGLSGPARDGVVPGLRLRTDWGSQPPVELWRRPLGPGVSSFAVRGQYFYTQEQRGEDEIVSCYHLATGEPVWKHHDTARFWDAHVGAGPRATPALTDKNVYTLGATGILNALDADTGAVLWSRSAGADTEAKVPVWGFVSSPLVAGDLLIVQADSLIAYDLETGQIRWTGPKLHSYSSPQLLQLRGVPQIVLIGHDQTISVDPVNGKVLWEHPWPGVGIVQPVVIGNSDLLISLIDNAAAPIGTRRIALTPGNGGWKAEERWTSNRLKTSFSDVVVHQNRAYGFDGNILACIDVESGERLWKGGRYGEGQLLLLPEQGLLLVVTEQGELALVEAGSERFNELARIPMLEGKTWSQPALIGNVLLVRNGEEMAAFRLPVP